MVRAALCGLIVAPAAAAHGVTAADDAGTAFVVACLLMSGATYALGMAKLARRGRALRQRLPALSFLAGWLALAAALLTPLDTLAARSFAAHMVQHEILILVAAPLCVLGQPLAIWSWALPHAGRLRLAAVFHHPAWQRPWHALTAPLPAWALHAAALWIWHLPLLFEAALARQAVHVAQHASFLGTALLFWWALLRPAARHAPGVALALLFTTMLHSTALGALLTLATHAWYGVYGGAFGLDALEDQQLGGLVMWVPGGLVYLGSGLALAARWLAARPTRAV
ncbi:MAG: cytochrome c oxidase assembly protein [Gammaproteobacteria bacterium]|nr:cytochrome c oxidase assembly protein [Gammaproteobacteria bacterium]